MRIGAVFPQTEIGTNPALIRGWVEAVEDLGFRHVLAFDHVLGAGTSTRPDWTGPYTSDTPFHEVFVLYGYLAAVTRSIELVTAIVILPQRQTALVAKQAAAVDVLSEGRMRLGIGIGWNAVEYEVLGESFGDRGARSEEQIAVLRALWSDTAISYRGRWHAIEDAGINPLPVRRRIPVWIGGGAEATLRRVGRVGDGWFPQRGPNERAGEMVATIHESARAAGRAPEEIGIEPRLNLAQVPAEEWAGYAARWRELGATHLCINTMGLGYEHVGQHVEALRHALETLAPVAV